MFNLRILTIKLLLAFLFLPLYNNVKAQIVSSSSVVYERQVVKQSKLRIPREAIESGLGGSVRVSVTVDALGNVISVNGASGPGAVCSQVTRPDVVAMRAAASEAAKYVKFVTREGELEQTFVRFDFPGRNEDTVKGEKYYSAVNAPPSDYKGPVSVSKNPDPAKDGEKSPEGSGGGSGVPVGPVTDPDASNGARMLSGGVLNGKANSLPRPQYPAAARAVKASGAVTIQVLIDETGDIFSAETISGHPLLRASAIKAACGARFDPTYLEGKPVKVSGVITYNFVP